MAFSILYWDSYHWKKIQDWAAIMVFHSQAGQFFSPLVVARLGCGDGPVVELVKFAQGSWTESLQHLLTFFVDMLLQLAKIEGRKNATVKDRNGSTYKAPIFMVSA